MRRVVLSFLLAFALAPVAIANQGGGGDGPKPLGPKAFFDSIRGFYVIESAGGHGQHEAKASVELESEEAVLTVPYCLPTGGCDPGYIFFPLGTVSVFEKDRATHMIIRDGSSSYQYSWKKEGDRVYFTNYQYRIDETKTITLVHVLRRVND